VAEGLAPIRARIGLIIPSSNRLTEPQFFGNAPEGVQPHVTRLRMTGAHHVPLLELLPRIAEAARALGDALCDVIVFHCTGSSMSAGREAERRVVETIQEATGRRAATTATGVLAAFEALGARRLVLVTPYVQASNDHEVAFLAEAGIEVLHDHAMDFPARGWQHDEAPPAFWVRATEEVADARADAYFLSCTAIHTIDAIEVLEARLQRPVITSNQATLWYCLRVCGLADVVPGFGRLAGLDLPAGVPA
jgi:maleate isomerase